MTSLPSTNPLHMKETVLKTVTELLDKDGFPIDEFNFFLKSIADAMIKSEGCNASLLEQPLNACDAVAVDRQNAMDKAKGDQDLCMPTHTYMDCDGTESEIMDDAGEAFPRDANALFFQAPSRDTQAKRRSQKKSYTAATTSDAKLPQVEAIRLLRKKCMSSSALHLMAHDNTNPDRSAEATSNAGNLQQCYVWNAEENTLRRKCTSSLALNLLAQSSSKLSGDNEVTGQPGSLRQRHAAVPTKEKRPRKKCDSSPALTRLAKSSSTKLDEATGRQIDLSQRNAIWPAEEKTLRKKCRSSLALNMLLEGSTKRSSSNETKNLSGLFHQRNAVFPSGEKTLRKSYDSSPALKTLAGSSTKRSSSSEATSLSSKSSHQRKVEWPGGENTLRRNCNSSSALNLLAQGSTTLSGFDQVINDSRANRSAHSESLRKEKLSVLTTQSVKGVSKRTPSSKKTKSSSNSRRQQPSMDDEQILSLSRRLQVSPGGTDDQMHTSDQSSMDMSLYLPAACSQQMEMASTNYEFEEDYSAPCMFFDGDKEIVEQLPRSSLHSAGSADNTVVICNLSTASNVVETNKDNGVVDSIDTTKKDENGIFDSTVRRTKKNDAQGPTKEKSGGSRKVRTTTTTTANATKSQKRSSKLDTLSEHPEPEVTTRPISRDKKIGKNVDV